MKKIIGLTLAVLLVIGLVGGGTYAIFSDTETSTDNTFTVGTLNLRLTGGTQGVVDVDSVTQTWDISLNPGESGGANGALTLANTGNVAGELTITGITHTHADGTAESRTAGGKSIEDLLMVWIFFDEDGNGIEDGTDQAIYGDSGAYAAMVSMPATFTPNPALVLDGPGTSHITLKYNWPVSDDDNDAQGDVLTFGFTVNLTQTP
jgi:predicted ribosomally synthesized peptide with SipW-like signal peptide